MDRLRAMELFLSISQTQNFSETARRLGISATAVSRMITDIEDELKVKLLLRSTRQVALTESGQEYARQLHRGGDQPDGAPGAHEHGVRAATLLHGQGEETHPRFASVFGSHPPVVGFGQQATAQGQAPRQSHPSDGEVEIVRLGRSVGDLQERTVYRRCLVGNRSDCGCPQLAGR